MSREGKKMPANQTLIDFIKVAHAGQVDKGAREDYWKHPVAVMNALPPFASQDLQEAALCHDVPEDTAFDQVKNNRLTFNPDRFETLDESQRNAKRTVEIELAKQRQEANPEQTAEITESAELSQRTIELVHRVTNKEFVAPDGISDDGYNALKLEHYQNHIIELAEDRPEDPELKSLAEETVLLKFADMSQNLDRDRVVTITDSDKATWFATKYGPPFDALLFRAKEIAAEHGYELHAETELQVDASGNKRFFLKEKPQWQEIEKGKQWTKSLGDRSGRAITDD